LTRHEDFHGSSLLHFFEPHPSWFEDIAKMTHLRRSSGNGPKGWKKKSDEGLIEYANESTRLQLVKAFGRDIKLTSVLGRNATTTGTPCVESTYRFLAAALPGAINSPLGLARAARLTKDVNDALADGPGINRIVSEGLDGFTSCFVRLRRYIEEHDGPLFFL
jgi:hypothetical protein